MNHNRLLTGKIDRDKNRRDYLEMLKGNHMKESGVNMVATQKADYRYLLPQPGDVYIAEVTPEIAADWLRNFNFRLQRNIRTYQVSKLLGFMERGTFRDRTSIDFGVYNGTYHLVNGQHTLSAIIKYGKPFTFVIIAHDCKTQGDLSALYVTFDQQLRRTDADAIRAHEVAGFDGLKVSIKRSALSAVLFLSSGFDRSSASPLTKMDRYPWYDDPNFKARLLDSWMPELSQASDDYYGTGRSWGILSLRGVMSVALVTYRYQPKMAHEFWHSIMMDDGLRRKDPRKTLIRMLSGPSYTRYRNSLDKSYHEARYCASSWNLFHKGEERETLHVRGVNRPVVIAHTPHEADQRMVYVDKDMNILDTPIPFEN